MPETMLDEQALSGVVAYYDSASLDASMADVFSVRDSSMEDFSLPEYILDRLLLEDEWGTPLTLPDYLSWSFNQDGIVLTDDSKPFAKAVEVNIDETSPYREEMRRVARDLADRALALEQAREVAGIE